LCIHASREAEDLEADELRRLLPQPEFAKATGIVEMIAKTPEERQQYEARRKAALDLRSFVADARKEGLAEGLAEGREEGRQEGLQVGRHEGLEEGRKEGLMEQVQLLQSLAQVSITSAEELMKLDMKALRQLCSELRAQIRPTP
jgi:flagellar biosynthesis/type III secretory pathway protein FliH